MLVISLTSIFQFNGIDLWSTVFEHSAWHTTSENGFLCLFLYQLPLHDLCFIQLSMIYVCTWPNTVLTVRLTLTLFHHHHHHHHNQLLRSAVQVILSVWICFCVLHLAFYMAVASVHAQLCTPTRSLISTAVPSSAVGSLCCLPQTKLHPVL